MLLARLAPGKTTTLRSVIRELGPDISSVYILNPYLTATEFYEMVVTGLRLGLTRDASKPEILNALSRYLAQRHSRGLKTVLIIDEAHGLSPNVLEEIRLLANIETNTDKLLQIVLCGQPELKGILNHPGLRQLKQRISLRCGIEPLSNFEVNKYIRFRLKVAGAERVDLFEDDALELISTVSVGIPRVINNICDNALLLGYATGQARVSRALIAEVIDILDLRTAEVPSGDGVDLFIDTRQNAAYAGSG